MNEMDIKVILALANSDLNISKAAVEVFCHMNTIRYHVKKIRAATGLDPLRFYDLCKLVQMIRKEDFSWINSPKMPQRQERPE